MNKSKIVIAIVIGAVFVLSSFTINGVAVQQVTINAAGSTFVEPLFKAWAADFYQNVSSQNAQVNYNGIGSGGGIAEYTNGTVNIGASDAPLQPNEQANAITQQGTTLQFAESLGGIVISYNIPSLTHTLTFNSTVLAEIFQRNITNWNDPAIQQLNPSVTLPSNAIVVVHRSDGSGTTFAFTNYLKVAAPSIWKLGQSKSLTWPAGTTGAKGNPGVAQSISTTSYAIGYVEYGYALLNPNVLKVANLYDASGENISITPTAVANAAASAASNLPAGDGNWSSISIVNQPGTNIWPITTFTYLIVAKNLTKYGATGSAMVAFLHWIITSQAQAMGPGLGYVELPAAVIQNANTTINSIIYDTSVNPRDYTSTAKSTPGFELGFVVIGLTLVAVIYNKKRKQ